MAASPTQASGIILYHKDPGLTSFQALGALKKSYGPKLGHTGTLDKFASGLLVVLSGRATHCLPWFSDLDKKYRGTIVLGEETDTLDGEGEVIARAPVPSEEALRDAMEQFRGPIMQAPPAYSAIHIEGQRASSLARSGKTPDMKKREVIIHSLELISYHPPYAEIDCHVSKGTYIRSLARDLALAAGSRGRLSALKRYALGPFLLEQADSLLRPLDQGVFRSLGIPILHAKGDAFPSLRSGKPLRALVRSGLLEAPPSPGDYAVFGPSPDSPEGGEGLLALIRSLPGGDLRYGYVYAGA